MRNRGNHEKSLINYPILYKDSTASSIIRMKGKSNYVDCIVVAAISLAVSAAENIVLTTAVVMVVVASS